MNFEFLKKIKFSEIVGSANKTLGVCKKAIPVYKEVRPFFDGKKKLFKKNDDNDSISPRAIEINKNDNDKYNDNLTFFQ